MGQERCFGCGDRRSRVPVLMSRYCTGQEKSARESREDKNVSYTCEKNPRGKKNTFRAVNADKDFSWASA